MTRTREALILSLLTSATVVVSVWTVELNHATWLEAFSFVTGALCVWLTVKESVWNFPISLANVIAFGVVFAKARLFADAGLQAVYFVLTIQGWYLWLFGGEGRSALHISRSPRREMAVVMCACAAMTAGLTAYLRHVGDAMPFWDAFTTAISLCAQWLLNRKYVENWHYWIAVDILYVPLYAYKSLYLTSLLYVVFLAMAMIGLMEWLKRWREQANSPTIASPLETAEAMA